MHFRGVVRGTCQYRCDCSTYHFSSRICSFSCGDAEMPWYMSNGDGLVSSANTQFEASNWLSKLYLFLDQFV